MVEVPRTKGWTCSRMRDGRKFALHLTGNSLNRCCRKYTSQVHDEIISRAETVAWIRGHACIGKCLHDSCYAQRVLANALEKADAE